MKTQLISLVSAVLVAFALSACSGSDGTNGTPGASGTNGANGTNGTPGDKVDPGKDGADGKDGQDAKPCTGTPPSTPEIQMYENQAEEYYAACMVNAIAGKMECDKGPNPDACPLQYDIAQTDCQYYRAICFNTGTMYVCGIEVFTLDDVTHETKLISGIDTDGDGVDDSWEVFMGLNPCEAFSYGTCSPQDGKWDFDGDGKNNAVDPLPTCNPTLGPDYQSDCI